VPLVLPGTLPIQMALEAAVVGFVPPSADKGDRAVAKTDQQRQTGSATEHRKRELRRAGRPRTSPPGPPPLPEGDLPHRGIISLVV
jgi:hypothetical protein